MGEKEFEQKALVKAVDGALQEVERAAVERSVSTPGGRFLVRWDEGGSATALGQLPFFAEFLEVSGVFACWVDGCPIDQFAPAVDIDRMYRHPIVGVVGAELGDGPFGDGLGHDEVDQRHRVGAVGPGGAAYDQVL